MIQTRKMKILTLAVIILWTAFLLTVAFVGCSAVSVGTLASSKVSQVSLETWNTHELGRLAQKAQRNPKGFTSQEWADLEWHREMWDQLKTWERIHNDYLLLAGKQTLTKEDENKMLALSHNVIDLMDHLVKQAKAHGYKEE